ncbi:MAG: hypothetical protein QM780_11080 [Hyphomicrobium sp.]|uniref:hypothetical protein n=1 Tax=Hyphomicrobium sp. TaxID=82 RepID=UPI0039E5ADE0
MSVTSSASLPAPPVLDPEKRLNFAQGLHDRLLASAIEGSLDPQKLADADAGNANEAATAAASQSTNDPVAADAGDLSQIATDDQMMSLPFNSQAYTSGELPRSAEDSFRAEYAMSDMMAIPSDRAAVAENEEQQTVSPPPKVERNPGKRKVTAQKRRPPQTNQMTAAAAANPPAATQQPNLPPPPLLFFLGAPPPTTQGAPVPQAPAAAPAPKPQTASPPNNSWVPDSLSDAFKNAY